MASLRGADFSSDGVYRYSLFRTWGDPSRLCNFLMLNPSTADAEQNDPTVERCERRARAWGYGGLVVTNLFAFRSTDPKAMLRAVDPVGPINDAVIGLHASRAALVVCAWGKDGGYRGRSLKVVSMLQNTYGVNLHALKVSEKTGEPFHPLYLSYDLKPFLWKEGIR